MTLKRGSSDVVNVKRGTSSVAKVMVGTNLVWPTAVCTDVLTEPFNNFTDAPWATSGAAAIVAGRTGTAAAVSSNTNPQYTISAPNQSEYVTLGFAFRTSNVGAGLFPLVIFRTTGTNENQLAITTTGGIQFFQGGQLVIGASSASGLVAVNTWYYIEVQFRNANAPDGWVKVRLNGVEVINVSGQKTRANGIPDSLLLYSVSGMTRLFDDMYLSTGAGCAFKGDPNPGALLYDPCDNFTAAPWVTAGSVAVTASGRTGNGFSIPADGPSSVSFNIPAAAQNTTVTFGCWIKFSALPLSFTQFMTWRSDAGATNHVQLAIYSAGLLAFYRTSPSQALGIPLAHGMVTGTWYRLEASLRMSDTIGQGIVRKNGAVLYSTGSAEDTKSGGTKTVIDQLRFNGNTGIAYIIDDVYIRNDLTFTG
jgi:hypothetical protein